MSGSKESSIKFYLHTEQVGIRSNCFPRGSICSLLGHPKTALTNSNEVLQYLILNIAAPGCKRRVFIKSSGGGSKQTIKQTLLFIDSTDQEAVWLKILHLTLDTWHVTHDTWRVTRDMWHVTCDTWWGVNIITKCQLPSSFGLWFMIFWRLGGKTRGHFCGIVFDQKPTLQ